MSDLTTFRLIRSVQNTHPDKHTVFRPLNTAQTETKFVLQLRRGSQEKNPEGAMRKVAEDKLAEGEPGAGSAAQGSPVDALLIELRELDLWLTSVSNRPVISELGARVERLNTSAAEAGISTAAIRDVTWLEAKQQLFQTLIAAMIVARRSPDAPGNTDQVIAAVGTAQRVSRRLLVAGLVEMWGSSDAPTTPDGVFRLLSERTLVLADGVMDLVQAAPDSAVRRGALARRPGCADLYVVRSEWSCYLPGEIAHIENVMRGEFKERVHTRLDETEVTQTTETLTRTLEERDTQSTDRFSLESATERETSLRLAIDASVDTSGQYGPTRVSTHVGGSFDYSVEESARLATTRAQELVAKAVSKVEQEVRQVRTTRTMNRITDVNTHTVDAVSAEAHIVGIYRWVDKIERVQIFRYPQRYLLEFQIPEPAAYIVWAREQNIQTTNRSQPVPFTLEGTPNGRRLAVTDVTILTYADLAARYGADVPAPPQPQATVFASMTLEAEPPNYAEKGVNDINLRSAPAITKTVEAALPDGYLALNAVASASATPALARWGDWESLDTDLFSDSHYRWRWGYHYPRVDVVISNSVITMEDDSRQSVQAAATPFRSGWLATRSSGAVPLQPASGRITIAATAAGTFRAAVSVAITCFASEKLLGTWAADAYARIHAAFLEQQKAYEDSLASVFETAPGVLRNEDPPELNKKLIHEELKRLIVSLLLGEPFDGFSAVVPPGDLGPRLDLAEVAAAAPYVQFLEQAFEWENLSYTCYPYFWGARANWLDNAARRSTDPEFMQFLRAGSVRVVLPARPGFAPSVNAFLAFGVPWGGGPAPAPDQPLYLSIADEIRAMQRGPRDGEPGESWEVRLPTKLIWLDSDSSLPKVNPSRQLTEPPDAICPR